MDAIAQVVRDIIDLKIECNNTPPDATVDNMFIWYEWAFTHGIIEVLYKYGQLQGFLEWVRLPRIPESASEVQDLVDYSTTGPVLYITQCCVRDDNSRHGVLWRLIHGMREKNPTWDTVCWHENGKQLHVWENNKIPMEVNHVG